MKRVLRLKAVAVLDEGALEQGRAGSGRRNVRDG
jgi:hypothetical protein